MNNSQKFSYQQINQQIEKLVSDWLQQIIQDRSLDEIIADMQQQAQANGLTEEILQEILEHN
jgi:calcineurin-like phosphoesterase